MTRRENVRCENCEFEYDEYEQVCPDCGFCDECGGDDFDHYEECTLSG